MNRFRILQRSSLFALICALLFLPLLAVRGQDSQIITAEGTFTGNGLTVPFTLQFPPNGGPVTGTIDYSGEENIIWVGAPNGEICPLTMKLTINGTFSGGDGGAANGDFVGREEIWCPSSLFPDEPTESTTYGPDFPFYGWSGIFYANGTGNGVMHLGSTCLEPDCKFAGGYDAPWQVTFSAAEFQAALPNQVTSEYIYKTYGIRVEDSFGEDGYEQSAWSDRPSVFSASWPR